MWEYIKKNLEENASSVIKEYDYGKTYTYLDLLHEIESIEKDEQILAFGGAKCAILCRKDIETVKALLLCWRVGMTAIPLSLNYGQKHCKSIIETTAPDIIISDDLELCDGLDIAVIIVNGKIYSSPDIHITIEEELQNVEIMMCTSGTTGDPKAIMFSGKALQKNVELISCYFTVSPNDTILICRPIYHCAVLVGELLLAIQAGANIVFYSGGFQPFLIADMLRKYDVTVMCGTPTLFKNLADCLKHRGTKGKLKTVALSGEYLLMEYARSIRACFPQAKIFNVYGLTEAGPRVSYLSYNKFDKPPQSVGQPLPGVEIKIMSMDADNNKNEQVGEVWVKSPSLMLGYYKAPDITRTRFQGEWFNTGDIGTIDKNGDLYILGRTDEMIIKAGMNIYPQEVERKILEIPEVKDVLVYGQIVNGVERIIAEIILQDKCEIHLNKLKEKMLYTLPEYMMPAQVFLVKDLPKNASGKKVRPAKQIREIM